MTNEKSEELIDQIAEAEKHANGFELAVKVEGGWTVMTYDDYAIWKNQK